MGRPKSLDGLIYISAPDRVKSPVSKSQGLKLLFR